MTDERTPEEKAATIEQYDEIEKIKSWLIPKDLPETEHNMSICLASDNFLLVEIRKLRKDIEDLKYQMYSMKRN